MSQKPTDTRIERESERKRDRKREGGGTLNAETWGRVEPMRASSMRSTMKSCHRSANQPLYCTAVGISQEYSAYRTAAPPTHTHRKYCHILSEREGGVRTVVTNHVPARAFQPVKSLHLLIVQNSSLFRGGKMCIPYPWVGQPWSRRAAVSAGFYSDPRTRWGELTV